MKTALKRKNGEFLVMPLKHVLSVIDLVNHSRTLKMWAISHENSHKKKKSGKFFATPLKNVLGVIGLVNHPGIPKLWAIAHNNGPKMPKQ
jgi:hypothetical protein